MADHVQSERSESKGHSGWHLANPTSSLHRRHMAFVYIVRCADHSLYVGSTDDVDARIVMHNEGRGSQYTKQRRPVTLVFVEAHDTARRRTTTRAAAQRLDGGEERGACRGKQRVTEAPGNQSW
jgi:putative endonuclease